MKLFSRLVAMAMAGGALFSCAMISGLADFSAGDCSGNCSGGADSSFSRDSASAEASRPAVGQDANIVFAIDADPGATGPEPAGEAGPKAADASSEQVGPPPVDSGSQDSGPPPVDSGVDSALPPPDAGIGGGPTCGPAGSSARCNANQVCCQNLSTQMDSCSAPASCMPNATLTCSTPADCSGSTPVCCAQLTLTPDSLQSPPPACVATGMSAACAASCSDGPPTSCTYAGAVRLCSHDADCASDGANNQCYNFNSAPVSWCVLFTTGGVHMP